MTSKIALTALALLTGASAQAQSLDEIPRIECPTGQELYSFGLASSKQTLESIGEPRGNGHFGPRVEAANGNQNVHLEVCVDTSNETAQLKRVQFRSGDFIRRGMFHGGNPMVQLVTVDEKATGVVVDPALKALASEEIHARLAPSKALVMRGSLRDLLFEAAESFELTIPLGDVEVPDFAGGPGGNRGRITTQVLRLTQKQIGGEKILVARPEMNGGKLSRDSAILTGKLELGNPFAFCEGTSQVIEREVTLGTAVISMKGCKEASFGGNGAAWSEDYKRVSIKDSSSALTEKIDITLEGDSLRRSFKYKSDQHHHYCDMFGIKLKNLELFWEPNDYGYSCNDLRGEKIEDLALLGTFVIPADTPGNGRVFGVRYNGGAWKFQEMPELTVNPFPNAPPNAGGGMIIRPNNR